MVIGIGNERRGVGNADPVVGVPFVILDGVDRKVKPVGDLLNTHLPIDEFEHLHLAGGDFRVELRMTYNILHWAITPQRTRYVLEVHPPVGAHIRHVVDRAEIAFAERTHHPIALVDLITRELRVPIFQARQCFRIVLRDVIVHLPDNGVALSEHPLLAVGRPAPHLALEREKLYTPNYFHLRRVDLWGCRSHRPKHRNTCRYRASRLRESRP